MTKITMPIVLMDSAYDGITNEKDQAWQAEQLSNAIVYHKAYPFAHASAAQLRYPQPFFATV